MSVDSDLGKRIIKKMHSNPAKLLVDSDKKPIAYLFNLSNIPKADNGKLINNISAYASYCKVQKAYCLSSENILSQLPLWCANCYEYADYTEREVIMKTADGDKAYLNDIDFLKACFIWSILSNKNKCLSSDRVKNEFCLAQDTISDKILATFILNDDDNELLILWTQILDEAKTTNEFTQNYTYGLNQIDKDINIKIGSGSFSKTGKEIEVPKYRELDEKIKTLKELLKKYYDEYIKSKLFEYELLK